MSVSGYVNYHIKSPQPQAFHIDADGVTGVIKAPELVTTQIALTDLRTYADGEPVFETDGVEFAPWPNVTQIDANDQWQAAYDEEIRAFFTKRLGAHEIMIFDHTHRIDSPDAVRKPARNVHSDYTATSAEQRLTDLLGTAKADEWRKGRFAFVNAWRPVENPINSSPLGFIRPKSISPQDWVNIALIYPDRRGEILGLVANPAHDWVYRSRMTPDEIVFFNIYDSAGLPPIAHSAIDRTEDPNQNTVRQSIETRMLVRY